MEKGHGAISKGMKILFIIDQVDNFMGCLSYEIQIRRFSLEGRGLGEGSDQRLCGVSVRHWY